jgi:predicted nuclease of restriction endonuclease-like (RecB) superfamily
MASLKPEDGTYKSWFVAIKTKISTSQVRLALAANAGLIELYWDLGRQIYMKQSAASWGDKIIINLAKDLKIAFPELKGFSARNLKYMRQFYRFYAAPEFGQQPVAQLENDSNIEIGQQPVAQIKSEDLESAPEFTKHLPWSHNIHIFTKSKSTEEATFYAQQTLANNWSRDVLALQLSTNLFDRQGSAVTNFETTLPLPQSDLANQAIKDPYVFDFMTLSEPFKEKDIEDQLVNQVSKFLLELGKGFAFIGRQYHIEIADNDYYLDLLFYHITLKCYVVIELKNTKFIPEYAGKMNFYLSAVDDLLKTESDQQTIGIMLCRDKNNIEAEFALRGLTKPMGVSEFQFTENVPNELKSSLPTIEEIETELDQFLED